MVRSFFAACFGLTLFTSTAIAATAPIELDCKGPQGHETHVSVDVANRVVSFGDEVFKDGAADNGGSVEFVKITPTMIEFGRTAGEYDCWGGTCPVDPVTYDIDRTTGRLGEDWQCEVSTAAPTKF